MLSSHRSWKFCEFLTFFLSALVVSYPQVQQTKNTWNYRSFNKTYCCSIPSPQNKTLVIKNWKLGDRDSQKWVSRLNHWWRLIIFMVTLNYFATQSGWSRDPNLGRDPLFTDRWSSQPTLFMTLCKVLKTNCWKSNK